ncbi:MAG: UDP-N-acetylmuramoyl-L-alanine--D-glutamate ligase [Pontiellaceae bacterium]|nr:UDP-N-acetylmuramoyl-L-alanine--D-glutamate ligase [Pontiellaceae bacterium]MBN2785206.1 UDP-N-acetylmuramoyl-L-alanine--D-glutamate ligase [Pontiellaceae bacterium]
MQTYSNALILGAGRSGRAAERLMQSEGARTLVVSRESGGDDGLACALRDDAFDVCLVSPGFALDHPWLCAVREQGIPLLSEFELGWSRHRGRTIAVTGSNGKSTAVKWIHEALCDMGLRSAIGGNYGIPACEVVMESPDLDWLVLEVSSFQLETVQSFRADAAIVLNILPNHLDRHGSMEGYWKTKARLFECAGPDDICLVPDAWLELFRDAVGPERRWVSFGPGHASDFRYQSGRVLAGQAPVLDLSGCLFDTPVLGDCTGAAVAGLVVSLSLDAVSFRRAALQLEPLPHRFQRLGEIGGVTYINDSKATNLAAMAAGIQACSGGVHLIAGGLAKETDYTFVKEILAEQVTRIYLIGKASEAMYQAWNMVCSCVECDTLEQAFDTAERAAAEGETILLSPGCASFDQFCSFEERGACFEALFNRALKVDKDAL